MNGNCQCNKIKLNFLDRRNSQLNTSLLFEKMGGRLNVDFKNQLKPDLFLKSYIYSERGDFAASFYNKNSILIFFSKWSVFRGGGLKFSRSYEAENGSYSQYTVDPFATKPFKDSWNGKGFCIKYPKSFRLEKKS